MPIRSSRYTYLMAYVENWRSLQQDSKLGIMNSCRSRLPGLQNAFQVVNQIDQERVRFWGSCSDWNTTGEIDHLEQAVLFLLLFFLTFSFCAKCTIPLACIPSV